MRGSANHVCLDSRNRNRPIPYGQYRIFRYSKPGTQLNLRRYNILRVPARLTQRTVLRTGYGAVIAVLVLSAVEAWRIQNSLSAQNLVIYRHHAEQDKALRVLRFNVWEAGNYVRDFLIVSTPPRRPSSAGNSPT